MVTVIEPPKPKSSHNGANGNNRRPRRTGGGGGTGGDNRRRGGGGGKDDHKPSQPDYDPKRAGYRIGMGLMLVGITLMFGALSVAYISLSGSTGWRPIALPPLLWLSTALVLFSSLTLEKARHAWRTSDTSAAQRWLMLTASLGVAFILSQVICWRSLVVQGVYLASDYHSAFFYLLTGVHALHIVGGIAALSYLMIRVRRGHSNRGAKDIATKEEETKHKAIVTGTTGISSAAMGAGALYWHFVGGLWGYIFVLLLVWQ